MGSIRITETSQVGEAYNTVEYEFSDIQDYFIWSDMKQEALSKALKSYSESLLDTQDEVDNNVTEVWVNKKKPKETKH